MVGALMRALLVVATGLTIAQAAGNSVVVMDAADPVEYAVKKILAKGYCSDWRYLPEGGYPKKLNEGSDAKQECAMRCEKSFGKQQAFYLRDSDSTCACSKGHCAKISQGAYTAYQITSRPGTPEVPQALAGPEADEAKYKTKEKDDMKYRKGLFRMGMKLQGLLNQLSRTDDKKQADEIKEQIKAIRAKVPFELQR